MHVFVGSCLECFDAVGWLTSFPPVKTSASKPLGVVVNVSGWGIAEVLCEYKEF